MAATVLDWRWRVPFLNGPVLVVLLNGPVLTMLVVAVSAAYCSKNLSKGHCRRNTFSLVDFLGLSGAAGSLHYILRQLLVLLIGLGWLSQCHNQRGISTAGAAMCCARGPSRTQLELFQAVTATHRDSPFSKCCHCCPKWLR